MKAVVFRGPYEVEVRNEPEPRIEHPADAIVRITTTNICGSDLHMYEGRAEVEAGKILGHENMGVVEEVDPRSTGSGSATGCRCRSTCHAACVGFVLMGWTSFCLRMNPTDGVDGAAYGYAQMGPYQGGQAEFLRVPFADFTRSPCLWARSSSRTSPCSATSSPPAITAASWRT